MIYKIMFLLIALPPLRECKITKQIIKTENFRGQKLLKSFLSKHIFLSLQTHKVFQNEQHQYTQNYQKVYKSRR
jgi:hypothetical protein